MNPTKDEWIPWFITEPQFEQFRAIEFLNSYDAVIYVDTDIIIKPGSPNIIKKYRSDGTNIVLNTTIGNNLLGEKKPAVSGYNTGVVIWYNKSFNTKSLVNLKPKNYGYNLNTFALGDFIESRKDFKWWKRWDDFKPFIGKFKSGMYNDDKFMGFLISVFNIPVSHLHRKYNYIVTPNNINNILSDNIYFIHYTESNKNLMEKHYNLIMEQ
jgi:hypothetical protein